MFKPTANYQKLKTNLRLTINRLKLLEKKKTELAQKARREIADYIAAGKEDRARIRVEHIIREDYLVEAMEIIEMYCDLLLARFGIIQSQKELDAGLEEPIASIIWSTPRLQADVQELKTISDQFSAKYGKEFAQACITNTLANVNEKVMHKLGVQAPPKILVERYMIEIARNFNVPFEPDPTVMQSDEIYAAENLLIDYDDPLKNPNDSGVRPGHGSGGGGGQGVPPIMYPPQAPMPYPSQKATMGQVQPPPLPNASPVSAPPYIDHLNLPSVPSNTSVVPVAPPQDPNPLSTTHGPVPSYNDVMNKPTAPPPRSTNEMFPELPSVPSHTINTLPGTTSAGGEDVDFDDLTRRFEELKRKK